MQIVIDIPEDVLKRTVFYREFRDLNDYVTTIKALEKATPLTKEYDIQRIVPKRVDIQKWVRTKCPNSNCDYGLSTHHGDGYYSIEYKPNFCPNCGQALLWESEE